MYNELSSTNASLSPVTFDTALLLNPSILDCNTASAASLSASF